MGKTPHHMKAKFDTRKWPERYAMYRRVRPVTAVREHIVYDLRYSAAELRAAEEQGRRPQPRKGRHVAQWWTYTGAWTPSSTRSFWASKNERSNRRYIKRQLDLSRRVEGELQQSLFEKAAKKPRRMLYDIW